MIKHYSQINRKSLIYRVGTVLFCTFKNTVWEDASDHTTQNKNNLSVCIEIVLLVTLCIQGELYIFSSVEKACIAYGDLCQTKQQQDYRTSQNDWTVSQNHQEGVNFFWLWLWRCCREDTSFLRIGHQQGCQIHHQIASHGWWRIQPVHKINCQGAAYFWGHC